MSLSRSSLVFSATGRFSPILTRIFPLSVHIVRDKLSEGIFSMHLESNWLRLVVSSSVIVTPLPFRFFLFLNNLSVPDQFYLVLA